MKRVVTLGAAILAVAGCATVSQMTATGGSRADGIVRLSFEAGMFDKVQIDEATALDTARRRCSTWGYNDAEAFGGISRQCQGYSSLGCMRWFVTKEYQCTSSAGVAAITAGAPAVYSPPVSAPASIPVPGSMAGAAPGTIDLGGGVLLVPSKTVSGYCIKAPNGYRGTGSVNRPAVTSARPICN